MSHPTMEERLAARHRPKGSPVMRMRWDRLLFLHWSWDPAQLQALLPKGLLIDTCRDQAWLAIVPFFMRRVHPRGLPCVPWVSDFLELNVRTYVHDDQGVPGVWFFSLSCNQPLAVQAARTFFHLNYVHARMKALERGAATDYTSQRHRHPEARFSYEMPPSSEPAALDSLEFFLLERYVLFSADRHGRVYSGRVHHAPYQAGRGTLRQWTFSPAEADGLRPNGRSPDHILMSERVEVEAWPIQRHFTDNVPKS